MLHTPTHATCVQRALPFLAFLHTHTAVVYGMAIPAGAPARKTCVVRRACLPACLEQFGEIDIDSSLVAKQEVLQGTSDTVMQLSNGACQAPV